MEPSYVDKLLDSLITSGPVAAVLSVFCWQVWKAYRELQADFIGMMKSALEHDKDKGVK